MKQSMYTLMKAGLLRSGEDFEGRHFFAFPGQNSCGVYGEKRGESCYYFDRAKSYSNDKWNPAKAGMQSYSRNRRARLEKARIHPAPN